MAAGERAYGLDGDVRREHVEADRDQPLRAALGVAGRGPRRRKAPEDDEAGDGLDQRVGAEADQRDRRRGQAGADRDRGLHDVPADAEPRKCTGAPHECGAVDGGRPGGSVHGQLDGDTGSVVRIGRDRISRWPIALVALDRLPTRRHTDAMQREKTRVSEDEGPTKLSRKKYEKELAKLHLELVKLQYWIKQTGQRLVLVFEGRDAAGKGGTIKRILEPLNPRGATVVALGTPSDREKTQWYFQRYAAHLPGAGEIVLFDRSWYNRAGVEHVMGFCTPQEYREFLRSCPEFERMLVRDGMMLRKYWFSVSDEEQERRFQQRSADPLRRWKLSPMDLDSRQRWVEYSRAKDEMFEHTHTPEAPWHTVEA